MSACSELAPTTGCSTSAPGPGALLEELARAAARPQTAIGLDSSAAMLARAPELPRTWQLVKGEAGDLPFSDASFDIVTATYLLHLLDPEKRAAVIAEARRVLAPGGRFGAITVSPPAGALGRLGSAPVRALARRSGGALAGLRPLDPRPELEVGGLFSIRARRTRLGYPSLCVVCEPRARARDAGA